MLRVVVNMSKSGRLIAAVAAIVVVVADRQQRLTISMRGRNAVAPQTVLTLLKGRSATSKDIPAAALLAAPRGTAYIYIKSETLISRSLDYLHTGVDLRWLLSTVCLAARSRWSFF